MRPIKFSKKEWGVVVLATSLAVTSLRPSDPWVYGPMLILSWLACSWLAYYHEGPCLRRFLLWMLSSILLSYVAYRNFNARSVTLEDISEFAGHRILAVSPDVIHHAMLTKVVATAFWVDDSGWAASCAKSVAENSGPGSSGPVLAPQINATIDKVGSLRIYTSGTTVPFRVVKGEANNEQGLIVLFTPEANSGMTVRVGPSGESVPLKATSVELFEQLPKIGERIFLYGAEEGIAPRFTAIEGKVRSVGVAPNSITAIFSDLPYRDTYCGAPIFNEGKQVIGIVVGSMSTGETEILPASFIAELLNEKVHKK